MKIEINNKIPTITFVTNDRNDQKIFKIYAFSQQQNKLSKKITSPSIYKKFQLFNAFLTQKYV